MLVYSGVCHRRAFYCEWLIVPRCRSQSIWLARPGLLQLFGLVCSSLALRVLSMPAAWLCMQALVLGLGPLGLVAPPFARFAMRSWWCRVESRFGW